jgi:hypothetical protein
MMTWALVFLTKPLCNMFNKKLNSAAILADSCLFFLVFLGGRGVAGGGELASKWLAQHSTQVKKNHLLLKCHSLPEFSLHCAPAGAEE